MKRERDGERKREREDTILFERVRKNAGKGCGVCVWRENGSQRQFQLQFQAPIQGHRGRLKLGGSCCMQVQ